ncbi:MAG: alanine dehydrogenase [Flavobacteriales bacterium]|nr:alanine dehydrogenase [Flavobacteriales bacterium]
MQIGLLREGKNPPDKRVPFSPKQCRSIMLKYPKISIFIQSSSIRCFKDSEYERNGVKVCEDLSMCDVIMGVKEVPVEMLIPNKVFFFFSHTIKKQPYNKKLLQEIIKQKIQLVDYETLVDENNKRIIGFGRYAGIVGCYNTFLAYGKKHNVYDLNYAHHLSNKLELESELKKVKLSKNFKIILTGLGRVASGAKEILDFLDIKFVNKNKFINKTYDYPVYTQLEPMDYYKRSDGSPSLKSDFYKFPEKYSSILLNYCHNVQILITGHYHAPNNPVILSNDDIKSTNFSINVIGDISCDINEPIASTIRPSTINDPIYGYNPISKSEDNYMKDDVIAVMAVDNLPCSLPKDASEDFGEVFIENLLPDLLNHGSVIKRASITRNGSLTKKFKYLTDYIL